MPGSGPRNPVLRYLARFDDALVLRWAFRGLLAGTIGVLAMDFSNMVQQNGGLWPASPPASSGRSRRTDAAAGRQDQRAGHETSDPRQFVTADEASLQQPIRFDLGPDGVLSATGTIDAGAAARFAAELEARGEYVRVISLDSPGGSLEDAMKMAQLVRKMGLATEVADGSICASSCPLFFAGGVQRRVGPRRRLASTSSTPSRATHRRQPAQAMADAQVTTARISQHLAAMGVDPAMWLHALVTPPRALYYLSPAEMLKYRLVTTPVTLASK